MTIQLGDRILMLHDIGHFEASDASYHGYLNGQTYTVGKDIALPLAQLLKGDFADNRGHIWHDIVEIVV